MLKTGQKRACSLWKAAPTLSMIGREYTRQAVMDIKVTVTTNEQNDDVMRFGLSEPIDISLTGTDGTKQLKELFSSLMHLLIEDEVCLSFIKTEGYGDNARFFAHFRIPGLT